MQGNAMEVRALGSLSWEGARGGCAGGGHGSRALRSPSVEGASGDMQGDAMEIGALLSLSWEGGRGDFFLKFLLLDLGHEVQVLTSMTKEGAFTNAQPLVKGTQLRVSCFRLPRTVGQPTPAYRYEDTVALNRIDNVDRRTAV